MKKLLNTLYLTQDNFYLTRERDNIVVKQEGKVVHRFPYRIIDGIVCFSYLGASPSLIELCVKAREVAKLVITFLLFAVNSFGRITASAPPSDII